MTNGIQFETSDVDESDEFGLGERVRGRRSRRNRWHPGLASHTVIENLEDPREYRAFELSIVSSFGPRTVIELALIHRLTSLLWRLRRASAIEAGLLGMQGEFLLGNSEIQPTHPAGGMPAVPNSRKANGSHVPLNLTKPSDAHTSDLKPSDVARLKSRGIAQCFLRLSRLDPVLLDRAGAYEMRLWRQAAQTIWILDAIRRPPPAARRPSRKAVPQYFWDRQR
jgi:hypothetical protein